VRTLSHQLRDDMGYCLGQPNVGADMMLQSWLQN